MTNFWNSASEKAPTAQGEQSGTAACSNIIHPLIWHGFSVLGDTVESIEWIRQVLWY